MLERQRLDVLLVERGVAPSREKARAMIMAGEISVDQRVMDKPGIQVQRDAEILVKQKPRFVSRGGDKLAGAIEDFQLRVADRICADVGASTGGFTDCLLQYGAARVYAIDVGYGQLDYSLRKDDRVVVLERTNARYLTRLPQAVELVTIDASFISIKLLFPAIKGWLQSQADIIALIKPQFEAGRQEVGKGGVVRDRNIHVRVIQSVLSAAVQEGYKVKNLTTSRLKGPAGNTEFFTWLSWGHQEEANLKLLSLVENVVP